uniref:MADF domain-containing protein n=3 Tax=Glossina TaxID=44049 RepID=A0A1A9UDF4_GLOAU
MKRNFSARKKRSDGKWVVLNEEELIRQVTLRPVLYDRSLKGYRKASSRQQSWLDVSLAMDTTVDECRRRWRSLRDSFAKHYKQIQQNANCGDGSHKKPRKWIFYDQMSFLIPYIDSASYGLDDQLLDDFLDNSDDGQSIVCQAPECEQTPTAADSKAGIVVREEQRNHVSVQATEYVPLSGEEKSSNQNSSILSVQCAETNTEEDIDSDEKFLLSCAHILKRFTNRQNSLARLRIQQILYEIEFGTSEDACTTSKLCA